MPGRYGAVRFGNDGTSHVAGIGDVCLVTQTGARLLLKNVKHVPDFRLNLISVGRLNDEGYCNTFNNDTWKLSKGLMVVAKGKKHSSLYIMHATLMNDVDTLKSEDTTEVWHRRLAHMSEKGMALLKRKNVLSGMQEAHLEKCAHCLAGKQKRVHFKSRLPTRRQNPLELVHSDVCGPMKTRSMGGSYDFVTFIDDYSRKVWVYSLKTKDQVLEPDP